ncbi:RDD family protein [Streptomyces sp. NPDC026672]|uniref:RDD family protein n=1 Tax=unclassified Streptomyces TaxID=2593676 RepID=UPI003411004A
MSAPTPAPGDDRPREGYYPDPSIPGYVRYWNGAAWVPGTSRPAPRDGEPLVPPPGASPAVPAVEETGPHFFDEDPQPEPQSAWGADRARQSGFGGDHDRRVSWGTDPRLPADNPSGPQGHSPHTDGTATIPPADPAEASSPNTFVFRRPTAGPAADEGTMTFRRTPDGTGPVPGGSAGQGSGRPGAPGGGVSGPASAGFGAPGNAPAGAGSPGAGAGADGQGPGRPGVPGGAASGPAPAGFGAPGNASAGAGLPAGAAVPGAGGTGDGAGRASGFGGAGAAGAAEGGPGAAGFGAPGSAAPGAGRSPGAPGGPGASGQGSGRAGAAGFGVQGPVGTGVAQAGGVPAQGGSPMAAGPGGGQSSWAQQVHRLAGGDDQQVAPWKPPVEDVFQAAARRQAAARPAGLGRRLAARLVDYVVVGAVTAAVAVPFTTRAVDHVQRKIDAAKLSGRTVTVWLLDGTTGAYLGVVVAVLLVVGLLYEVLPTARWGRTLGKRLCGIEVRDIEAHEPPTFGRSLRRWLVHTVPGLLGIGVVGILWCLFDRPWHQCWHDKAAHTFVASR